MITTNSRAPGGQFAPPTKALPGDSYDSIGSIVDGTERLTRACLRRRVATRLHLRSGAFAAVGRELQRSSAVEPIVAHLKSVGHLGGCDFKDHEGDAANVILTSVGDNLLHVLA